MWYWIAHLENGSRLSQLDGVNYDVLPRQKLVAFDLWHLGQLKIRVDLRPDSGGSKALIWRRRTQMTLQGDEQNWQIVGFQRHQNNVISHHLIYLFEHDGSILLGGEPAQGLDFQEPIQPFEWESDLWTTSVYGRNLIATP